MTFSTILAGLFVIAIAWILIWMVWSLIGGRPSTRRGSGRPGMPFSGYSGMPGDSGSSGGYDGGGSSGGGDGGGGGGGC
ncbi:uncharacterized protein SAMN05444920_11949 [Nonomuraea solani]|uniref:Uncharacterized protein n=1 Tax=Nonomuraea solani TaxID=1144553 RepID=A0A1H6EW85_9ACTN|nr:hypothetical protein [Nonomuraea solani]SEH01119.1 uncharacterized protein SAMN05444920_11949 [Nonomuraea solani]